MKVPWPYSLRPQSWFWSKLRKVDPDVSKRKVGIAGGITRSQHFSLGGGALEGLDLRPEKPLGERSRAVCAHAVAVQAVHSSQASQPRREKRA